MLKIYLGKIQTMQPQYALAQDECLKWLIKAHSFNKNPKEKMLIEKKILRFSCLEDKIASRYSELIDFTHENWESMELFGNISAPFDSPLESRMTIYKNAVQHVFDDFYPSDYTKPPKHLIHVSCTGYTSPSAAQKLVCAKHWHAQTTVTHCYHMGCYAAFPAVRIAKGFLSEYDQRDAETIDIVHTELCSLHFNLNANTIDQHVVQSLFADGYAKYTLSSNPRHFQSSYLELLSMYEQIIPDSENAMTWDVGHSSFLMTISKSVPDIILKNINEFLKKLIGKISKNLDERIDLSKCIFAIHPGGPKIITCVQEALSLRDNQIEFSSQILKTHGNISSATLPHVWELILQKNPDVNSYVISLAFGPGLTVSGSIMKICHNEFN